MSLTRNPILRIGPLMSSGERGGPCGRGPCTYEGCDSAAVVNLAFGRNFNTPNPEKYGRRLWASYCPFHAALVCDDFSIEKARKVAA
jgi:hypothetical protein